MDGKDLPWRQLQKCAETTDPAADEILETSYHFSLTNPLNLSLGIFGISPKLRHSRRSFPTLLSLVSSEIGTD